MAWAAMLFQAGSALSRGQAGKQAAEAQGVIARAQGYADEQVVRREGRQLAGANAAALAESGLSPGGSSGLMAEQSRAISELDALNERYKGAVRGMGFDIQGRNASREGGMLAGQTFLKGFSDQYKPTNGSGLMRMGSAGSAAGKAAAGSANAASRAAKAAMKYG